MGQSLKTSCNSFIKHLESKGFKKTESLSFASIYEGDYLGNKVSISLTDSVNGHFKELMLTSIFINQGSDAKQYYVNLCNNIEKEHSGFRKEENNSYDVLKSEFYGENGSMITVMYTYESYLATVVAVYKTELETEQ